MQKSISIFVPQYPLDNMCSDGTSFEDYIHASHASFAFAPEGDFIVDTPTFTKAMNVANISDEAGLISAIVSHKHGENVIVRLTCDILVTAPMEISGIGDLVIDGCGHRISFIKALYTPKSYVGDAAVCPYNGIIIKESKSSTNKSNSSPKEDNPSPNGSNSFVTPDGTIIRLSRSDFYNAAGEITINSNSQPTNLTSSKTSSQISQYSFLLPKKLGNLTISQDEDVCVNFTASYKSFTFKAWTATENGSNYLCFRQEQSEKYNDDYVTQKKYTSFFFINKDLSPDACFIKDSNLYFPSRYEWIGELEGGFTIKNGNIKFQNIQLTGTAPINAEGEACLTMHKCAIYGATAESAITITWKGKAYISQCNVYDCLGNGILAKYGSTIYVTDSHFHDIGLFRAQTEAIESRGKYYIARNKIEDFCYGAIRVGVIDTDTALHDVKNTEVEAKVKRNVFPCCGIVEYNDISLSRTFYDNANHLVGIDGGAIYIATNNGSIQNSVDTETFISYIGRTLDTTNVCVVRFNHIKNYRGRGTNRGIFCDDDAYNFLLLGNIVENTPNDLSISARFAESIRKAYYLKKDYNKKVFYNVVDNGIRFEGNLQPVENPSEQTTTEAYDGCEMKYNLYLNKYANMSNIIRYTSREDNVYVDDTGFFTKDGRIDSAYNITEWNINIKNRRHERR